MAWLKEQQLAVAIGVLNILNAVFLTPSLDLAISGAQSSGQMSEPAYRQIEQDQLLLRHRADEAFIDLVMVLVENDEVLRTTFVVDLPPNHVGPEWRKRA